MALYAIEGVEYERLLAENRALQEENRRLKAIKEPTLLDWLCGTPTLALLQQGWKDYLWISRPTTEGGETT